jgi:lactobin A/cerein 7B family class IIb bacteriocin
MLRKSIMQELKMDELVQVNGGIAPLAVMAGAHMAKSLYLSYRVYKAAKAIH